MIAYYELRVFTTEGLPVVTITDMLSMSASRTKNEPGAFEIVLPPTYDENFFGEDYIVEIWRSVDGRTWRLIDETCWFVRDIQYDLGEDGAETLTLRGHDTTGLLSRHQVAWYAFSSANTGANVPGYKTAPADTAIYEIWDENFGSGVEGTLLDAFTTPPPSVTNGIVYGNQGFTPSAQERKMPRGLLNAIETGEDAAIGPIVEASVAWTSALEAMKQIAEASVTKGADIWFDIAYTPGESTQVGRFKFQVWVGNRGSDLSDTVVLSPYWGTMKTASLRKDYTNLANWIHVGGAGQGDLRLMGAVIDGTSVLKSPFYPIEAFVDAGDAFAEDAMIQAAEAELRNRRGKVTVSGEIVQSAEFRFGREYRYGDIVAAFYRNVTAKVAIDRYSIEFADGVETINIPGEGTTDD